MAPKGWGSFRSSYTWGGATLAEGDQDLKGYIDRAKEYFYGGYT